MKNKNNILELSSNITKTITLIIEEVDKTIRKGEFRHMITGLLEKARGDSEQIVKEIEKENNINSKDKWLEKIKRDQRNYTLWIQNKDGSVRRIDEKH